MPKCVTQRQYPHICEGQHSSFRRNVAVVQAVGNTVSALTGQKYEPPIQDKCVTARPTGQF